MKKQNKKSSTRELLGIESITDISIQTRHGDLVFFMIKPTNISVLSESSVSARIYSLMTVLKGMAEIEMLCLNSKENFDDNKTFLKKRLDEEPNPAIRKLLTLDSTNLDRMQVSMATAREFLIIIRLRNEKESDVFPYLSRIEKSLKDQGFISKRADENDIKRILGVYFEEYTHLLKNFFNSIFKGFANLYVDENNSRKVIRLLFLLILLNFKDIKIRFDTDKTAIKQGYIKHLSEI